MLAEGRASGAKSRAKRWNIGVCYYINPLDDGYLSQIANVSAPEFEARQKMRAEEVSAISEAIAILNDDDSSLNYYFSMHGTGFQYCSCLPYSIVF